MCSPVCLDKRIDKYCVEVLHISRSSDSYFPRYSSFPRFFTRSEADWPSLAKLSSLSHRSPTQSVFMSALPLQPVPPGCYKTKAKDLLCPVCAWKRFSDWSQLEKNIRSVALKSRHDYLKAFLDQEICYVCRERVTNPKDYKVLFAHMVDAHHWTFDCPSSFKNRSLSLRLRAPPKGCKQAPEIAGGRSCCSNHYIFRFGASKILSGKLPAVLNGARPPLNGDGRIISR